MGKVLLGFIPIFVALDIFGALPLFLSVTRTLEPRKRDRTLDISMWVAFGVAIAFIFLGEAIFRYLGIQLFDFKIAGGLILLLVSLVDLVGNPEVSNRASGSTGVVPLAVPLITGPGVLTTVILQANTLGYLVTLIALLANYLLAWVVLRKSHYVSRILGQDGITVISKIAALLLAAIAVAMIRSGVFEAIASARAA